MPLPRPCHMPSINLCLQIIPFGEQRPVHWRHFGQQLCETSPESSAFNTRSRQCLLFNKIIEFAGNFNAVLRDIAGHFLILLAIKFRGGKQGNRALADEVTQRNRRAILGGVAI